MPELPEEPAMPAVPDDDEEVGGGLEGDRIGDIVGDLLQHGPRKLGLLDLVGALFGYRCCTWIPTPTRSRTITAKPSARITSRSVKPRREGGGEREKGGKGAGEKGIKGEREKGRAA